MWEIMLCSWQRVSAICVTLLGPSMRVSSVSNLVAFPTMEKNRLQVSLRLFIMDNLYLKISSYERYTVYYERYPRAARRAVI